MCMMCPDFVDLCTEGKCAEGTRGYTAYYLMSTFCIHLSLRHGTDSPSLYSHVDIEHDWTTPGVDSLSCEDNCIANNWYRLEDVRNVVKKIKEFYGQHNESQ